VQGHATKTTTTGQQNVACRAYVKVNINTTTLCLSRVAGGGARAEEIGRRLLRS